MENVTLDGLYLGFTIASFVYLPIIHKSLGRRSYTRLLRSRPKV